ncbi:MAG: isochorismatase family protein [Rhizobiales bacterium]|nr:isochorismatase family protein [Hyphomicrobiales bacterium]
MKLSDHKALTLAETVHPKHTCIAIHDMQNDFCTEGGTIYKRAARHPEIIAAAVRETASLVKVARGAGVKIVYFKQFHLPNAADIPASHVQHLVSSGLAVESADIPCIRGTWGHQIVDALAPHADDIVIDKASFNDIHGSIIDKVLRIQVVETVLLTGVSSHAGVLGTYFGVLDCGYHFYLPRECVAGYVPELHEAAMKIMRPHVVGAAEIVQAWGAAGKRHS